MIQITAAPSLNPLTGGWEGVWGRADGGQPPRAVLDRGGRLSSINPGPPPSPSANLILLGTVHGDPQGYERAWKLLDHFRPEIVTVEISPFSVRYRGRAERRWQKLFNQALAELPPGAREHLALRRIAAQVALPFEYRVARDWGQRYGIPVKPLDLSGPARRHLPRYGKELLSPANLKALLQTPDGSLEDFVTGEFSRARRSLDGQVSRLPLFKDKEARERECFLARRLRRLAASGARLAHLGGWEHLPSRSDGAGLAHLLNDLNPGLFLLNQGDHLPARAERNKFR
ncbi:MAG: hypothetical protein AB1491_12050 [Thermodesulfobacteriota bacterium]